MLLRRLVGGAALTAVVFSTLFAGCAMKATRGSPQGDDLDGVIREVSTYLNERVPHGDKVAFVGAQQTFPMLVQYVIDNLIENAVNDGTFTVIDRAQLDAVRTELQFQTSGEVSDETMRSLGRLVGAKTIVTVAVSKIGNMYRFGVRALEVESAEIQGQINRNVQSGLTTVDALAEMQAPAQSAGQQAPRASAQQHTPTPPPAQTTTTTAPAPARPQTPTPAAHDYSQSPRTRFGLRGAYGYSAALDATLYLLNNETGNLIPVGTSDFGAGYEIGVVSSTRITPQISFQLGVNFMNRTPFSNDNVSFVAREETSIELKENAITVPTLIRYGGTSNIFAFFVESGLQFEYIFPDINDRNSFDVGLVGGYGFRLGPLLEFDFRLIVGLLDFADVPSGEESGSLYQMNFGLTYMIRGR